MTTLSPNYIEQQEAIKEPVKRPADRWRNRYLVKTTDRYLCGTWRQAGEVYPGTHLWPSKDTAETEALRSEASEIARRGECNDEYLGAFPE